MADSNFYHRNLPHWQPYYAEYFVTFRLNGSLPSKVINQLKRERKQINEAQKSSNDEDIDLKTTNRRSRIFRKYESILDLGDFGPTWLANSDIADIIYEALLYRDEKEYDLYAFCIMPNHVHVVFKLLKKQYEAFPVTSIMKNLKSFTALKANRVLDRTGVFWQSESYDRVIRDQDELENTIKYVLANPVKAGLTNNWKEWGFSYCKSEFSKRLR
jgi:REP element-mobilizing transposase RayT